MFLLSNIVPISVKHLYKTGRIRWNFSQRRWPDALAPGTSVATMLSMNICISSGILDEGLACDEAYSNGEQ